MRVFLDASVMVAATLSSKGGSFRVVNEAAFYGHQLFTSRYAYRETEETIAEKRPESLINFIGMAQFIILIEEPPLKLVKEMGKVIDIKDAPIVAAAVNEKVEILLTLDRKHFLENIQLKKKFSDLKIITPGEFIQNYLIGFE